METKVVSYKNAAGEIRVVVGEETAIARMRHVRSKMNSIAESQAQNDDDDTAIMRIVFYPDAISGTLEYHGFTKPTFEEFLQLPGEFVDLWLAAVWELIPSWKPGDMQNPAERETEEDAEKKE